MKLKVGILLGVALFSGCARVQPWDKDILAQPYMEFRLSHKTQRFMNHAVITMEQAEGGDGSVGGGCGCR